MQYLTTFRPYRVKLKGSERIQLAVIQSIAAVNASAWMVSLIGPRVRHFDIASASDRCLKTYVDGFEFIGWGRFDGEIAMADALMVSDPELSQLTVADALRRIQRTEAEYQALAAAVQTYVASQDPDNMILKFILVDKLSAQLKNILKTADQRARERFRRVVPTEETLKTLAGTALSSVGRLIKGF